MPTLLEQARELKNQRAVLIKQNRDLNDTADTEKRAFTQEETNQFEARFKDIEALSKRIDATERMASIGETEAEPTAGRPENRSAPKMIEYRTKVEGRRGLPGVERLYTVREGDAAEKHAAAFRSHLATGLHGTQEIRALENTNDPAGGYTTPPMQWIAELIRSVDNAVFIRQFSTVTQLTQGDSMGRPSLDADPADPTWTTELDDGDEDSTMAFGKRELVPQPIAKNIKVSKTLLRRSALNIEALVRERLAYKMGVTQEAAFMTGTGASQPLGVFTASASGIATGRDVSTGNTTTAFTVDGLKNAKYSIKGAYWPRLRWIFHRDAVRELSKLKDGDGRYIWSDSIVDGEPDRLLGFPTHISEYAPNTFTTGLYVGILGDFSYYWIAEALNLQVERLNELYAETNQVGFIIRAELDGMPTLGEAFARVKLA